MPDVVAAVTAVATATGDVANQITQREKEKNATAVVAAAAAAEQQAEIDRVNKNVAGGNLQAIREDDAE
jgi:hypothetical protein